MFEAAGEGAATIHHPRTCGPCEGCREALADYAAIPAYVDQRPAAREADRGLAENDVFIRLPVWVSSRTTGVKPQLGPKGLRMLDLYELPESTGEELARHVARYGTAGVPKNLRVRKAKTAEELAAASKDRDLQAVAKKRDARKNARRPTVKAEVAKLLARKPNLLPSVVADTVGISDRRVKTILAELAAEA